jgi:integrase
VSLIKRGNVWWAYFYQDGIRQQHSTDTSNRKQAELIEAKLKEQARACHQSARANPNMKFGELAARFLASASVRPHHISCIGILLPFFAEIPVSRFSQALADEFRRRRLAENVARPIKDSTINRSLAVLRHLFYWGVDEQILTANPLARLKMPRERHTHRQVLSIAEEQLLLPAAVPRLQAMIVAALDTGMRRGELFAQRWEDIDFSRTLLSVTHSKTAQGEAREIPLTERLKAWLLKHRQDQGAVFGSMDKPISFIQWSWGRALIKAGIRHVRFHDLRHTFNTRLMEAGVMQEIRMALMGHSPGASVNAIYTHVEVPAKREAIRKLEAWVNLQQQ